MGLELHNVINKKEVFPIIISLPKSNRQGYHKDKHNDLKDQKEKGPELIKHFNEKIPVKSNVWRQIRNEDAINILS